MQYQRLGLGLSGVISLLLSLTGCGSGDASSSDGGGGSGVTVTGGDGGGGAGGNATGGNATGGNATGGNGTGGSTTGSATGQWVLGYYVGYQINDYPIDQIDWSALTHIAFAGVTVKDDMSLDLSFFDQNGTGIQDAKAISAAAHAHGVSALILLGGAGAGQNLATASSPAHRAAFVADLLSTMDMLGYDGIDLDWEESVNLDDLVALAQALRAAKPDIVLTYPAGMVNGNYQTVDPRLATLAESLDQFNVQAYFPSTAVAGYGWDSWFNSPLQGATGSTPIAIDDTLLRYEAAGIPRSKLGLGMGFYAMCYSGGITGPRQPTDGSSQQILGGDNNYPLRLLFEGGGTFDKASAAERKFDATAQVPYLSLGSPVYDAGCDSSTQYISYDDEASIIAKGTFSKANGYGGIMVWTIQEGWLSPGSADGRPQNALMQALKKGFLDP